jgi:hypothetical protein
LFAIAATLWRCILFHTRQQDNVCFKYGTDWLIIEVHLWVNAIGHMDQAMSNRGNISKLETEALKHN